MDLLGKLPELPLGTKGQDQHTDEKQGGQAKQHQQQADDIELFGLVMEFSGFSRHGGSLKKGGDG